jgi:hypothetical protein
MGWNILLIGAIAALFYIGLPGIGAFLTRARWRLFRSNLNEVSRYPTLGPAASGGEGNGFIGYFRVFGTLEAIQGEDRIWISTGTYSVAVDVRRLSVYMLPGGHADAELRSVTWNRIFSLPEGTNMLVGGALFGEDGRGVFRSHGKKDPLVVIHECRREQIIERAVWGGRQRNEYWNPFTLPSLITGATALFVFAYTLLGNPDQRIPALIALALSVAPISPFLPPAFPLYFLSRRAWKNARLMRAQRDVVRLPLRYFPPRHVKSRVGGERRRRRATLLPNLEPYIMLKGCVESGAPPHIECAEESIDLPQETRRIDLSLPRALREKIAEENESYVFGVYAEEGERIVLRKPEDPMAELILIPGDPEAIARECGWAARLYELTWAFLIGANVAVNMAAVLYLLAVIIA